MQKQPTLQKSYFETLKGFLDTEGEEHLAKVADLGRKMVLQGLHPESVAEMHHQALESLARESPDKDKYTLAKDATLPLAELLMAYGLAFRERMVSLEKAHTLLEESEQRFRDFAEAANDWFWEMGSDYEFSSVSRGFQDVTGVPPDYFLGKSIEVLMPSKGEAKVPDALLDALKNQVPFRDYQFQAVLPGCQLRWLKLSGKPLVSEDGRFLGFRGTGSDITAQIETREMAETAKTRLVESLDSITEGFVLFNADRDLILCNQQYRNAYPLIQDLLVPGASMETILASAAERGQFAETEELRRQWVKDRIARHDEPEGIVECRLGDGKWYRISESCTPKGGIVKVLTDITQSKFDEQELEAKEGMLRRAQEAGGIGIWQTNLATGELIWSEQTFRIYGLDPNNNQVLSYANFLAAVHPEDREGFQQKREEAIHTEIHFVQTVRAVRPDGGIRFVEIQGESARDQEGSPMLAGTVQDITERVAGEAARRASEERIRTLVDTIPYGIQESDQDGVITLSNPAHARMMGYEEGDLLGKRIWEFAPTPEKRKELDEYCRYLIEQHPKPETYSGKATRKDGRVIDIQVDWDYKWDENGLVAGMISVITDITQGKRAEQELRYSEERLSGILDIAQDAIISIDENHQIILFNHGAEEIFGYKNEEVNGQKIEQLFPERFSQTHTAHIEKFAGYDEKASQQMGEKREVFGVRKNGEEFSAEASISKLELRGTKIYTVILRDITARKIAEDELKKSHALLQAILENLPVGLSVIDDNLKILAINQRFLEMLDFPREQARQWKNLTDFIRFNAERGEYGPGDTEQSVAEQTELIMQFTPHAFVRKRPDGTSLEIRGNPIPHGGFITTFADVTERRRLEEQLYSSQRMESIGTLAGGIAHDFNNILSIISSYSGFVQEQFKEGDPGYDDVRVIQESTDRAASLTRQLLAFSRRQVMKMETINLNKIIQNMEKMLVRLIGENIHPISNLVADLAPVKADVSQIEQIILNLAVNARDAMPKGGKLTIDTANLHVDEEAAKELGDDVKPGAYVRLRVSDTGTGMDDETRVKIFEPFFTTKGLGQGTGLGLSTVYGIVKQMEGHIVVTSLPDHGATFTIFLPSTKGDDFSAEAGTPNLKALGGRETILLVEDEELVRKAARRLLEKNGYSVIEASQGDEALTLCKQHQDQIQLLLTDVVMPGMSGGELGQKVASLLPQLPILYMSGYTDEAIVHHGVLEEGVTLLQKPFSEESLLQSVGDLLKASNRATPS